MSKKNTESNNRTIATNRKARHEYFIEETLEAGMVLTGTEIKSIRAGYVNLQQAFCRVAGGEMWVIDMHVSPYDPASRENHDPTRPRKLMMHRREILRWEKEAERRGYTIVPLRIYIARGRAKLEIGLAKGKHLYDKREDIAKRDAERHIERERSRYE